MKPALYLSAALASIAGAFEPDENWSPIPGLKDLHEKLHPSFRRNLQAFDIPCNVPYAEYTAEAITQTLTEVFAYKVFVLGYEEAAKVAEKYIPEIKHDVRLMKVCASCESEGLDGYGCEKDDYGSDVLHSGLVMLPVEITNSSISIIPAKRLRPFGHFKGITVSPVDSSIVVYQPGIDTFEYGLLTAALGYVSIIPEQTGYGESAGLVPSPLDKKAVVTGTLPLYSFTDKHIKSVTGGKTRLAKQMAYTGWSGGGYQAIAAADGFKKHGIKTEVVLSTSAPIKLRSWTPMGFFRSVIDGDFSSDIALAYGYLNVALVTLMVSNTRPGKLNNGSGQYVLKQDRVGSLLAMFTDLSLPSSFLDPTGWFAAVMTKYPENFVDYDYFIDNYVAFYVNALGTGDGDPCKNTPLIALEAAQMDQSCAAADEDDLTNVKLDKYPINSCRSATDALVVIENAVEDLLKFVLTDGSSHADATFSCDALLFADYDLLEPKRGKSGKTKSAKTKPSDSKSGKTY